MSACALWHVDLLDLRPTTKIAVCGAGLYVDVERVKAARGKAPSKSVRSVTSYAESSGGLLMADTVDSAVVSDIGDLLNQVAFIGHERASALRDAGHADAACAIAIDHLAWISGVAEAMAACGGNLAALLSFEGSSRADTIQRGVSLMQYSAHLWNTKLVVPQMQHAGGNASSSSRRPQKRQRTFRSDRDSKRRDRQHEKTCNEWNSSG